MLTSVFDPARPSALRDLALLAARILLGVVLIAHGLQKLTAGFDGVTAMFAGMGIPLPQAAAAFAIGAEVVGGALLILGFLTPLAALWWWPTWPAPSGSSTRATASSSPKAAGNWWP